ncbi:MAG: DNA alkylation repair protein [Brumimicrobium sp.]
MITDRILKMLENSAEPERLEVLKKFFKSEKGEYAEGDVFIGVTVPNQRNIAKQFFKEITLDELQKLINNEIHEVRSTALFILVLKFQKLKFESRKKKIVEFYLKNLDYVNHWDLVDSSAYKILGPHLLDKNKKLLYDLAYSDHLWRQRISIITTLYFIKKNRFYDTLELAKILINHEHDLIHKAVGWMIREVGNRDFDIAYSFLIEHYKTMPRTMLRYAIEKFDKSLRKDFLRGKL